MRTKFLKSMIYCNAHVFTTYLPLVLPFPPILLASRVPVPSSFRNQCYHTHCRVGHSPSSCRTGTIGTAAAKIWRSNPHLPPQNFPVQEYSRMHEASDLFRRCSRDLVPCPCPSRQRLSCPWRVHSTELAPDIFSRALRHCPNSERSEKKPEPFPGTFGRPR